jgi:tricorn protease
MVDGGTLTQPEFAFWGLGRGDGWTVENHGVDPDIEVQNLPQELAAGIDAQLDRGIEELLRLRAQSPPVHPRFESAPDKSRRAFEDELKPAQ